MRAISLGTLVSLTLAAGVAAAQTELKNDGFMDGANVGFQGGFVTGEIGAVRLSPGAAGTQVQFVHFLFGGEVGTRTITLRIWDDQGGGTSPGTEIFNGDYDVTASDTAMQEIDLRADDVFVLGDFRVGIEFQHSGPPSIARDDDGNIQPNRNFILADGLGWIGSADVGLTGDWIIRAVVEGGTPPQPDAGPGPGEPDAGGGGGGECQGNGDCQAGEYCDTAAGVCTFDCREDGDCGAGNRCNSLGMCVAAEGDGGGCGCRAGAAGVGGGGAATLLALGALLISRRRRGGSRRTDRME
jgi:hypothetical protein